MFFSLSLAMGAMITYGSYLSKEENLVKNSAIIVICDSIVALMAGLAVLPAAVANGLSSGLAPNEIALGGPKLLFVTLQDVFANMGTIGPLFGVIFYLLVLIAAISSAISLMEVIAAFFIDKRIEKGLPDDRKKITLFVSLAITAEALLVAFCGLGSNGIAPSDLLGITGTPAYAMWNDCWLDFMDCWSEGIAMPLGAMLMAVMIGWEIKPETILSEIRSGAEVGKVFTVFYKICVRFVVPVVMAFVLAGQMIDFFVSLTVDNRATVSAICYVISAAVLLFFWVVTMILDKKENA